MSPECWEIWHKSDDFSTEEQETLMDKNFGENIEAGIWVHDGILECVNPKRALKLYNEYDKLYDGYDRRMFYSEYYIDTAPEKVDYSFAEKCAGVYGKESTEGLIERLRREWERCRSALPPYAVFKK
ncbi:MAG: hypothetical protein NC253_12005 [Ruminococcus sp.]|nr:hypothetical protein [Ruminococcus sp.]